MEFIIYLKGRLRRQPPTESSEMFGHLFRGIPLDFVALSHAIAEKCRDQHQLASWQCQKDGEMPDAV